MPYKYISDDKFLDYASDYTTSRIVSLEELRQRKDELIKLKNEMMSITDEELLEWARMNHPKLRNNLINEMELDEKIQNLNDLIIELEKIMQEEIKKQELISKFKLP